MKNLMTASLIPGLFSSLIAGAALIAPPVLAQDRTAQDPDMPSRSPEDAAPPRDQDRKIPPATIDTDGDGIADAWDRNQDGTPDAWDTDGDGQPDKADPMA